MIVVGSTTVTPVAGTPPTETVAPDRKPVPRMVIWVPPASGPKEGVTRVTDGGGAPGLIRATLPPFANQIAPSGPAAIPRGTLPMGRGNVVTCPDGVIRPTNVSNAKSLFVNQRLPSTPAAMSCTTNPVGMGNSV